MEPSQQADKKTKVRSLSPQHARSASTSSPKSSKQHSRGVLSDMAADRSNTANSANSSAAAPTPSTRVSAIVTPKTDDLPEDNNSSPLTVNFTLGDKSSKKSLKSWLSSSLKLNPKPKPSRSLNGQKLSSSEIKDDDSFESSGGHSPKREGKEEKHKEKHAVTGVSSSEEEESPHLDVATPKVPLTRHEEELSLWREMSKLHPERKVDDVYYLLAVPWLRVWSTYWQKIEQGRTPHSVPGKIDNACLFEDVENETLRLGMSKRYDYRLVSEAQWKKLHKWYGGGPVVRRHVIPIGSSALTKVEVYLLNLTVMTTTPSGRVDPSSARTLTVSRRLRVGEFRTMICKDFELDPKALRLWNFFSHSSEHALDDDARTLGEEGIVHGQTIVAQILKKGDKKGGGLALPFLSKKTGSSSDQKKPSESVSSSSKRRHRGCCGLDSWGSAPVLNPVIQCMSNTVPLCEYFLNDDHLVLPGFKAVLSSNDESDRLAHLGLQFATVLQDLWSVDTRKTPKARGISRILSPNLKQRCPSRTPTAIDIIEVLLRSLHWGLNRVSPTNEIEPSRRPSPRGTPKALTPALSRAHTPSPSLSNSHGSLSPLSITQSDKRDADMAWSASLLECQSIISDLFMGQLRNSRVCSSCHYIEVTYEMFASLSLPVVKPFENKLFYEVPVLRLHDVNSAIKYGAFVSLELTGSIASKVGDLKRALSVSTSIPSERIILVTVNQQRSFNTLSDSLHVSHIPKKQLLVAYELPEYVEEFVQVRVIHRKYVSGTKNFARQWKIYSVPFLVFVRPGESAKEIYEKVWHACKRFIATEEELKRNEKFSGVHSSSDSEQPHYKARIYQRCKVPFDTENCPFVLSMVSDSADRCALAERCTNPSPGVACSGCHLSMDVHVSEPLNVAIDWDHDFRKKHYHEDEALSVHVHKNVLAYRASLRAPLTLDECLTRFLSPQTIDDASIWKCKSCDEAKHQLTCKILRLPEILVLHLDRRPPHVDENHPLYNTHRENLVDFPLKALNLSSFSVASSPKPLSYDLYGVINHDQDNPLAFASALCNNKNDKYWYLFKDRSVRRSYDLLKLQSKRTNILFYRRSSALPGAWMTLKQVCETRIVNSILSPDNAVLLYQHACVAQAEDLKLHCISIIVDNLDVATRDLPDDAIMAGEASELIRQIADVDLEKRATYVTSKKEAVEDVCARCDRLERKKLHSCAICRRLVCKKCSRKTAESETLCLACSRLLDFTHDDSD